MMRADPSENPSFVKQPAVALPIVPPRPWTEAEHAAIATLAYEYWEARACLHGNDWEDWFRAERESLRCMTTWEIVLAD